MFDNNQVNTESDLAVLPFVVPLSVPQAGLYARHLALDLASVLMQAGLNVRTPRLVAGQPPAYLLLTAVPQPGQIQTVANATKASMVLTCMIDASEDHPATALLYAADGYLLARQSVGSLGASELCDISALLVALAQYVIVKPAMPSFDVEAAVSAVLGTQSTPALLACWRAEDDLALDPDDEDADDALIAALTADPGYQRAAIILPDLQKRKSLADSITNERLERVAVRSGSSAAILALAEWQLQQRNGPRAIELTLNLLTTQPGNAAAHRLAALLFEMKRDFAAAADHAARVVELAPTAADWGRYGHLLANDGRLDEAVAAWQQSVALDPANASALFTLGQAVEQQRDPATALDYYRRAVAADPNFGHAHAALGDLLYRQKQSVTSLPHLQRAAELDPADNDSAFLTARCYEEAGDHVAALGWYARAAAAKADFWQAPFYAATLRLRLGDTTGALADYRRVLAIDPNQAQTLAEVGAILAEQGQLTAALLYLERAAAALPQAEAPRRNLERVLEMLKG